MLEDTSVNGTYVGGVLVGKGNKVILKNGDEITLVAVSSTDKSWNPEESHGWIFTDLIGTRAASSVDANGDAKQRASRNRKSSMKLIQIRLF